MGQAAQKEIVEHLTKVDLDGQCTPRVNARGETCWVAVLKENVRLAFVGGNRMVAETPDYQPIFSIDVESDEKCGITGNAPTPERPLNMRRSCATRRTVRATALRITTAPRVAAICAATLRWRASSAWKQT
jgi:hypothetical protein